MPTGWRPADVAVSYPVYKISDVYHFEKYAPAASKWSLAWAGFQVGILLLLISYLFGKIADIGSPAMFVYGGFVFIMVYAYTELMDHNPYAIVWEGIKNMLGIAIIVYTGDWFGAASLAPWIKYFLICYFIYSTIITGWLVYTDQRTQRSRAIAA